MSKHRHPYGSEFLTPPTDHPKHRREVRSTRHLLSRSPGQPDHTPPTLVDGFEPIDPDTEEQS